jgi:hypothetical protein
VHVFTDDSRSAPSYHLYEVSSFSGATWSKPVNLGSAVQDNSFAAAGRQVELQVEKSGLWYTTATTSEVAGGDFKFTVKGTAAGTFDYRAVAADLPG